MKGQITLFVVLGIIVMIILGLGLFVKDLLLEARQTESADIIFREFEQTTSLSTYLKSCTRKVTNNGLTLLGYQGGYIYLDQGGTQDRPLTMPNAQTDERGVDRFYDLSYWIFNDSNVYESYEIPKLCSNTGPNKLGASDLSVNTCQFVDVYGNTGDNIQDSLATYIEHSLPECLDLEIYKTTRGNEISAGNPSTEIIFDRDSFIVSINYPFSIKIKGQEPVVNQVNYTYNSEVRLQALYFFMKILMEDEAINPDYNPQEDYFTNPFYEEGFIVQVIPDWNLRTNSDCNEECYDDLIWVKDESIIINNKPFEMMFAVQDRSPINDEDFDTN